MNNFGINVLDLKMIFPWSVRRNRWPMEGDLARELMARSPAEREEQGRRIIREIIMALGRPAVLDVLNEDAPPHCRICPLKFPS